MSSEAMPRGDVRSSGAPRQWAASRSWTAPEEAEEDDDDLDPELAGADPFRAPMSRSRRESLRPASRGGGGIQYAPVGRACQSYSKAPGVACG